MGRVHDGRPRPKATGLGEQLDRPQPVLGEAFVDLPRLLVGMHVQRQLVLVRIGAELFEPAAGARADGMGGEADADADRAQLLHLPQVVGRRGLPEAVETAAPVGGEKDDERDPRLRQIFVHAR